MSFKVRFLKSSYDNFIENKIYNVEDGKLIDETGYEFRCWSTEEITFNSLKTWLEGLNCTVELVEDETGARFYKPRHKR